MEYGPVLKELERFTAEEPPRWHEDPAAAAQALLDGACRYCEAEGIRCLCGDFKDGHLYVPEEETLYSGLLNGRLTSFGLERVERLLESAFRPKRLGLDLERRRRWAAASAGVFLLARRAGSSRPSWPFDVYRRFAEGPEDADLLHRYDIVGPGWDREKARWLARNIDGMEDLPRILAAGRQAADYFQAAAGWG